MYELDERDRIHMLLGERMSGNPYDPYSRQVPRGPNGRALIGDPRNDENRIVAQLHAVFLRFHNQVAKHLGENASFDEVRQQVRWHYQWVLVTDYLRTVINNETYTSVFRIRTSRFSGCASSRTASSSCPWSFPRPPSGSGTP